MLDIFATLNDLLLALPLEGPGLPLVIAIVGVVCMLDALIPPVPSESVVVGVATVAVAQGGSALWLIVAVAALGAWIGDNLVFAIGRSIGRDRWAWMRRPRTASAIAWAGRSLDRRGNLAIMTGRFIPVGRVAVNLTAGSTGFRYLRFAAISALATLLWAAYSVGIGAVFGHFFADQPLLAVALGIVVALFVGFAIDLLLTRVRRVRDSRSALPIPGGM